MEENDRKKQINHVICGITGAREARKGQIDAVYRLVNEQRDTVLVAATGYGKSAVLYAFSALTNLITVQIVPLTKLGENQRSDIARGVPNSKPVWIDSDTHLKAYILKHAGFDQRNLRIIRTSIDRPEIIIIILPLMRKLINDYRRLHFLVEGSKPSEVRQIPKTIIYVNSKPKLMLARYILLRYLQKSCGFTS
ncbi:hypothetical protein B0T24DRAFT_598148 [Lasiosphaeria ovina]|uniref:Uncharacterized protein n=1 Tax=Lasiosphaeria ovina TaxID=92902 RepID=A0AAE0MZ46_9PEZI|nr:hypothetical protein B0T24DRAFT_598148 [Lasiosphaeria ovina]